MRHHGGDMGPQVEPGDLRGRADRVGQPRRAVGRLGGVLGDVGGDRCRVARLARDEDPHVVLGTPARPADARPLDRGHRHLGRRHGRADRSGQDLKVEPPGRGLSRTRASVGSDDEVEVDQAPALELDHLHVGEPGDRPQISRSHAAGPGHLSVEAMGRPGPRARGTCAFHRTAPR